MCLSFLQLRDSLIVQLISGDARLARSVKNKVWSLDLVANDPSVIACDMSNVWASLGVLLTECLAECIAFKFGILNTSMI